MLFLPKFVKTVTDVLMPLNLRLKQFDGVNMKFVTISHLRIRSHFRAHLLTVRLQSLFGLYIETNVLWLEQVYISPDACLLAFSPLMTCSTW